jgi:hypothetical protein
MILARQQGRYCHGAGAEKTAADAIGKGAAATSPAGLAKTCEQAVFGYHRLDRRDIECLPALRFHIHQPHTSSTFAHLGRGAVDYLIDLIGSKQLARFAFVSWLTSGASAFGLVLAVSPTIEIDKGF